MKFLGIDVGTGGSRALVVDRDGKVLASATADHAPFRSPHSGWAEQDPEDWWRAAVDAVRAVLAPVTVDVADIAAVGLTGQMHGAVLLDDAGRSLRPALIWCDQRTNAECAWLEETVGLARLLQLTANPPLTNFTLTKLLWVRRHQPEIWRQVRHVLLPKDYVRFRLSGEHAIDVADASGTLLLDVERRRWSDELIEMIGIDREMLPTVFESPEICARVSQAGAAATGLRVGTAIVAGAGDQAAGAVGMGISKPGAVSATIGTSGVVFAATNRPATDPHGRLHTFCHAIPDRWHVMGVTQAAGLSLRWLRDLLGPPTPYDHLAQMAQHVPPGADGVMWAPYLMGERTPHCDPTIRAALVGLGANHGRGHVVRALMEGVAFSLRDTFEILSELRIPVERIRAGGGGARSPLWRQIQANVYQQPVETIVADEGAAFGAAILAGVGAGAWPSVDGACETVVQTADVVPCEPEVAAIMNGCYQRYRRMYPALRSITAVPSEKPHG
jgi:xylulokinase